MSRNDKVDTLHVICPVCRRVRKYKLVFKEGRRLTWSCKNCGHTVKFDIVD